MSSVLSHQAHAASSTGVMIALYTYPGSTWDAIAQAKSAHPSVPIVAIINCCNGPGTSQDSNYVTGIQKLHSAGVIVIGYVDTLYGARNTSIVKSEINAWKSFYNIDGIFFDEMANTSGLETYYSNLSQYAKSLGYTMTVGNPGTDTLPSYIGTVDDMMIYESPGLPAWSTLQGWHTSYNKSNFSMIAFGISSLNQSFITSASNYVGYIYITDNNLPNPYNTVPSYFGNEVAMLDISSPLPSPTTPSPTTPSPTTPPPTTLPDFSLLASPSSASIQQGGNSSSTITVRSLNGFSSAVGLTVLAPTGMTVSVLPTSVTPATGGSATSMLSISVPSSTPIATYTITVTGVSGSLTRTVIIPLTVSAPPPPTPPSIQSSISVNSVDLSGKPIIGMWTTIQSGSTVLTVGYTPLTYTVTAGSQYTVTVANYQTTVFNHWNDGSTNSSKTIIPTQSTTLTAYYSTGPTVPQSSTGLTATALSSSQINLSWTAPANNGGSAITGYKIERSTNAGSTWSTITNTTATAITYSDTGLVASTAYSYRVSAINSVGTSSPSNTASATTQSTTAPQPPTGLTATAVSSSQINLSWTAPTNNGGSAITGYKIERSTDAGTIWSTIANTTTTAITYSNTGLAHSITYTYKVSAINSVGTGSPSNTASATTFNIVPQPPTGLTATALSSSQIDLSWTVPANNGGSAITGYKIERSTDAGSTW
ncbi:MAG TPA: spherulation-specific family 4 protein, partial [Nitrosopumilaceae archaeon]|nr:spherulation-specific family 4 protein [Nitrosopumilaceae archaeon]